MPSSRRHRLRTPTRVAALGLIVLLTATACGLQADQQAASYGEQLKAPPKYIDGAGGASSLAKQARRAAKKERRALQVPAAAPETLRLTWPVGDAGRITSPYGWRIDPIRKRRSFHHGLDIGCWGGERITSAGPGQVVWASVAQIYGKVVVIAHSRSVWTVYGHLSRIDVQPGDRVDGGQIIGRCGSTGRSTGPHLHLEIRWGNSVVDPQPYLS